MYSDPQERAIYQLYAIDSSTAGSATEMNRFKIMTYNFLTASGSEAIVTDIAMFDVTDLVAVINN